MRNVDTIKFEIEINATIESVWYTMLGDEGYRIWTKEFNPRGSWYEKEYAGEFVMGEKVRFLGPDPAQEGEGSVGGMLSRVKEVRKYEYISFEHYGFVVKGQELTNTPEILAWAPSFENYTFVKLEEHKTLINIEMESAPEYTEMFTDMWPKALKKLKDICEV